MIEPQKMYAAILRDDLVAFMHRAFLELYPRTPYNHNWHLEILAAKLVEVRLGRCKRLIVNLPPRHLKSFLVTVVFPVWWLGHDPTKQIITVSYGQDLAENLSRESRALMNSAFYKALFKTRISNERNTASEFQTTERGFRFATSVGGVLTGRGASLMIVDDPMKADEALSDVRRQSLNDWFDNSARSRLNNPETDAIILVQQRLHLDDLPAHVQKLEAWDVVSFPAVAEHDEQFQVVTPYGQQTVGRLVGEALHPERTSLTTWDNQRRTMNDYNFQAQYQQDPQPLTGNLIKRDWIKQIPRRDFPTKFDWTIQAWDTAYKDTERAAFSACTTWGVTAEHAYLLHVYRGQLQFPALKRKAKSLAEEFKPEKILIEDHASGTSLAQELRFDGVWSVEPVRPTSGDKVMRADAQTNKFASGYVVVPDFAPWLDDYLTELTSFPIGQYADQVDSTTLALEWISQHRNRPAITQFYQQQRNQIIESDAKWLRIKHKTGTSILETRYFDQIQGFVTRIVTPEADGTFKVTAKEFGSLRKDPNWEIIADE